jgi:2-C-methyl-D-erythritol 4-phosphate cytidylyltransferase/2-C-methyl-D-erythritol 2,4-cyclodiphosphate synthase
VEGARETRVGFGWDVHELVPHRRLVLGGVEFQSPLGLLGHSDADIVCHAVSDALLGAAGEGDIGTLFPASDEQYRNIGSTVLLSRVIGLLTKKNWRVVNVDVVLVAQIPRLGGEIRKITENLKSFFAVNSTCVGVNVKIKSGEYVGSVGRAECMTCYAVASAERRAG